MILEFDFVPFLVEQTVRKGGNKLFGHPSAERLFQRWGDCFPCSLFVSYCGGGIPCAWSGAILAPLGERL